MYSKIRLLAIGLSCSLMLAAVAAGSQEQIAGIDAAVAPRYFAEAAELSRNDGAKLWGVSLAGPMLFVEPRSRSVVANQADAEGKLRPEGEVFVGKLPDEVNIANTATRWAGVKWTMIMWPLPEQRRARLRLMAHELFHRVQDKIGLESTEASNRHLDTKEGRIWLILEWRALERALEEGGAERKSALQDAIAFRRYRQGQFARAAEEEASLETQEGLAEYTGLKLSSKSDAELGALAAFALRQGRNSSGFTRSFAYSSAPAYGALLDQAGSNWRRSFKAGDDLSRLVEQSFGLKLAGVSEKEAAARAGNYDGDEVIAAETKRDRLRAETTAKYRAKFVDGAVLVIPVAGNFHYSFNPGSLVSLDDIGTVYPTMRVTDDWGILEVTDGCLLIRDANSVKRLQVAAPASTQSGSLAGPGWTLQLNAGWSVAAGPRSGDFMLRKQP
jgi:hypothetical protein